MHQFVVKMKKCLFGKLGLLKVPLLGVEQKWTQGIDFLSERIALIPVGTTDMSSWQRPLGHTEERR